MKITVIGAGGVGGYFGGKLAQAGHEVTFQTRGEALRVIEEKGLQVKSILGDFHVYPKTTQDPSMAREADLILICTKSWQLGDVAQQLAAHLDPKTVVLPLQNGADNAERLGEILPAAQVLGGLCKIVSKIERPGVIDHFTFMPEIVFGELSGEMSARGQKLQETFEAAGIKNVFSANIRRDIWLKFLFIASISGLGALTRSVLGVMREDDYLRKKIEETGQEIIKVGQAQGVELFEEDLELIFSMIDKGDFETTMSMQRDVMEGRPSELENFNGYVVAQGEALEIPTPVNAFIYRSLRPLERAARGL